MKHAHPRVSEMACTKDTTGRRPELLAPAGRMETFFAALEAGADAVYVGAHNFNARMRARNFTVDELSRMIAHAHSLQRRVYVTLNTLVREDELPDLIQTLDALRRIGPDALIVQDLGVYRAARRLAPELPLHASTQMAVHSLDGVLQAQRMGFERVILARELTLDEIRSIRASSTIELETFVHGAMCYSVSGECLFSSYLHGRSANRGRCAQPCRRRFEARAASGGGAKWKDAGPVFSMRDLETAPVLSQLIAAGIRSFKIEGRLKPAETIAQIVRAYRVLLDAHPDITRGAVAQARERLDTAVGREPGTGFYLSPAPDAVLERGDEAQSGRFLGKATPGAGGRFGLTPRDALKAGDRLRAPSVLGEAPRAFTVRALVRDGREVKRARAGVRVEIQAPFPVPPGASVVKVLDADAVTPGTARRYERLLAEASAPSRAAFDASLRMDGRHTLRLEVCVGAERVEVKRRATWNGSISAVDAKRVLDDEIEGADARLNSAVVTDDDLPLSAEELAALRDEALAMICRALDAQRDTLLEEIARRVDAPESQKSKPGVLVRMPSLDAGEILRKKAGGEPPDIVVPISEASRRETARWARDPALRNALVLALPTYLFGKESRAEAAGTVRRALDLGFRRFEISNLGHLHLLRASGRRGLDIVSAPGIGCMNSQCHAQLVEMGVSRVTYSLEGDREGLSALLERVPPHTVAVQVYGHVPLFESRVPGPSAPGGELRLTEPRETFRVVRRDAMTHVLPARAYSLRHRIPWLVEIGVGALVYDLAFAESLEDAAALLGPVSAARPGTETAFNFERGLE